MRQLNLIGALVGALLLSGCGDLPRGAAIKDEVVRGAQQDTAEFQFVEVSRANVSQIGGWPATGDQPSSHWPRAQRGPTGTVIQVGDIIDLVIWDNQSNSLLTGPETNRVEINGLPVTGDGTIFVPYTDEVAVRGLTTEQARKEVQRALEPVAPNAQAQLRINQGRKNSFSVVSGVGAPGSYPLTDRDTSILSAIALAGGVDPTLRNPSVKLFRGSTAYTLPMSDLYSHPGNNLRIRGGDEILIEEDQRSFTALGASGVEDIIYFPKTELHTLEALSLMGGINDQRADPNGVLILREYRRSALNKNVLGPTHEQIVLAVDLTTADGLFAARNLLVQPGDTIMPTESPVTSIRTVLGLVGQAFGLTTTISAAAN